MKRGFIVLALLIIISFNVNAITLQPPKIEINFQPGMEYSGSYNVKNDYTDQKIPVYITVSGDMNESFNLDDKEYIIPENSWQPFNFKIKMPDDIEPGDHAQYITINEGAKETGMVGAVAGVALLVVISKPYPGKYLSVNLEVQDGKINEDINFKVTVENKGVEDVDSLTGEIKIFDSKENLVDTINFVSGSVNSGGNREFNEKWKTDKRGEYKAEVVLNYDSNIGKSKSKFKVGELLVEILSVNAEPVKKDGIARFDINVQSDWNSKINNIHTEVIVDDKISKGESFALEGWESKNVTVYFDTTGLSEGEYNSLVKLYYESKEKSMNTKLIITKKVDLMMIGLIILVLLLLGLTYYNIRKFSTKKKKNEKK